MIDTGVSVASDPEALARRVAGLVERLDTLEDLEARETANELFGAMLELYGEGLERIFRALDGGEPAVLALRDALVHDGVVGSLLLIHGLHPVDLETRVRHGLDVVRPYMHSHGGNVELLGVEEGIARLRFEGTCNGCGSSVQTLELTIRKALEEAAPDLEGIDVDGLSALPELPVPRMGKELPMAGGGPAWTAVEGLEQLESGDQRAVEVNGARLLVASVDGTLLAYLDACAACGSPLRDGRLEGGVLACPSCAQRFELPRAGKALGDETFQLAPVPLLRGDGGRITVAVAP